MKNFCKHKKMTKYPIANALRCEKQKESQSLRKNVNAKLRENLLGKESGDMRKTIGKNAASDGVDKAKNKGLVEAIRLLLNPLTRNKGYCEEWH